MRDLTFLPSDFLIFLPAHLLALNLIPYTLYPSYFPKFYFTLSFFFFESTMNHIFSISGQDFNTNLWQRNSGILDPLRIYIEG
jgi:hypothetical protein